MITTSRPINRSEAVKHNPIIHDCLLTKIDAFCKLDGTKLPDEPENENHVKFTQIYANGINFVIVEYKMQAYDGDTRNFLGYRTAGGYAAWNE